jgi:signal transduction histidine kinase
MKASRIALSALLAVFFISIGTHAGACSKEDLVNAVKYAAGQIGSKGKAALPDLRTYRYCGKEGYLFVVNMEGTNVMHAIPQLEGKPMGMLQGAKGEYFGAAMVAKANKEGEGWISYTWENPKNKKIEDKCAYIKTTTMDGVKVFVGSGIYGVPAADCK